MLKRLFLTIFLVGCILSATGAEENIIVLDETPVAEFSLPDGSVLKNAFVWRRNSQGLMIVHDDGQHFLNYTTLPEDWKIAYLGESAGEVPEVTVVEEVVLDDRYQLAPVLDVIPLLSDEGVKWLLREDADDEVRQVALTLALFQSFAANNREKAKRYYLLIEERGYKIDSVQLDQIFNPCSPCAGKGEYEQLCPDCEGSGECSECEGKGLDASGLGRSKQDCKECEGSGECVPCDGLKKAVLPCENCRGRGQILDKLYCEVYRDNLVRTVNQQVGVWKDLPLAQDESTGVGPVLTTLPGLDEDALAYYLSDSYSGGMDTNMLVACIMQTLLKENMKAAARFHLMLEAMYPKSKALEIEDYLTVCGDCKGIGHTQQDCPTCKKEKKKGTCAECEGQGKAKKDIGALKECEACDGTGECADCKGSGIVRLRCADCTGSGRLFQRMRAEIKLELVVDDLNDYFDLFTKNEMDTEAVVE